MPDEEQQLPEEVTPRIVQGVAISANQGGQKTDLAQRTELAMSDAVLFCHEHGVTDPDKVRDAMMEARDRVVAG